MKRILCVILFVLLAGFIIIQFIQSDRNRGEVEETEDLITGTGISREISSILTSSCYDCHSDHTEYPWYSRIAPVSWFLEGHISKGKKALNFSHWENLEKSEKIGALSEICEEIELGKMPLKSYLLIHRDARLSEEEIEILCSWAEAEALRIMRE